MSGIAKRAKPTFIHSHGDVKGGGPFFLSDSMRVNELTDTDSAPALHQTLCTTIELRGTCRDRPRPSGLPVRMSPIWCSGSKILQAEDLRRDIEVLRFATDKALLGIYQEFLLDGLERISGRGRKRRIDDDETGDEAHRQEEDSAVPRRHLGRTARSGKLAPLQVQLQAACRLPSSCFPWHWLLGILCSVRS